MFHSFLDVQDLTTQRQNSLEVTVTALLGGAASGVTLNEVKLGLGRIALRAVGQFTRQTET